MTKAKAAPKAREGCIYRVFRSLAIRNSGQWIKVPPGGSVIADLGDCSDASLRILLDRHIIETAEGEPINKATGVVDRPPCPCSKKE